MKTILLTGATDGIGLETARLLASGGHNLLVHGRNSDKLQQVTAELQHAGGGATVTPFVADLSEFGEVIALASTVGKTVDHLDVLINNAGVFKTAQVVTSDGLDVRFVVNTIAPWLLTRSLLPLMNASSRIVNISSAARAPVDLAAFKGQRRIADDYEAYAQSKLAITMWTVGLAEELGDDGPMVVSVNPGSLLASKMVKEGFGVAGKDLGIGADILCKAALSDEFTSASGRYYDNDSGQFTPVHRDAQDPDKRQTLIRAMEELTA